MSKRRPDRDKELQRLLKLSEWDQIAVLRTLFGESQEDADDDDDLDGLERAARLTLHGTKGVPEESRDDDRLDRRLEALERETQKNTKAVGKLLKASNPRLVHEWF